MKTLRIGCGLLACAGAAWSQQYVITTVAGGAPPPTPSVAQSVSVGAPFGIAVDSAGSVYFASLSCVFKVDQKGILTRVAGNAKASYSGDGGPAPNAELNNPIGVAVDGEDNLFISDSGNNRIRKVLTNGIITTVAGSGVAGYSGDGGVATNAQLNSPRGVAVDGSGNIFFAEFNNNTVRKVSTSGIISTVAGNGTAGFSGDGGAATSAQLNLPFGVAVDGSGNVFIADTGNNRVREVSTTGIISTVAGDGTTGFSGDGGAATNAQLGGVYGVALDRLGNLFIADGNVRKVTISGMNEALRAGGSRGVSVRRVVDQR